MSQQHSNENDLDHLDELTSFEDFDIDFTDNSEINTNTHNSSNINNSKHGNNITDNSQLRNSNNNSMANKEAQSENALIASLRHGKETNRLILVESNQIELGIERDCANTGYGPTRGSTVYERPSLPLPPPPQPRDSITLNRSGSGCSSDSGSGSGSGVDSMFNIFSMSHGVSYIKQNIGNIEWCLYNFSPCECTLFGLIAKPVVMEASLPKRVILRSHEWISTACNRLNENLASSITCSKSVSDSKMTFKISNVTEAEAKEAVQKLGEAAAAWTTFN